MSAAATRLTTRTALEAIVPMLEGHAVVCANGFISRWAHAAGDRESQLYMIGSMGLAPSIGLGIALARPGTPVAVLDGDGNVLMNLGALAAVGAAAPPAFRHVVIDNGVYASTGNQPTISGRVAIEAIAAAAGYAHVARVGDAGALRAALADHLGARGPSFLLVEAAPDDGPPAPRIPFTPEEMTARMRVAIAGLPGPSPAAGQRRARTGAP